MQIQYNNGEEFFIKLNLRFNGILAVSLLPFGILWLAKKKGFSMEPDTLGDGWRYGTYGFILVVIIFLALNAYGKYRRSFKDFSKSFSLREKLDFYYRVVIRKVALLGMAGLVAVIGYLVDDGYLFMLVYAGLLFSLSIDRPAERKIEKLLAFTDEQKEVFRKKEPIP